MEDVMAGEHAQSPDVLQELSEGFTKLMAEDLERQIDSEAKAYVTELADARAQDHWPDVQAARATRWQEWSSEVIEPLQSAAPLDFRYRPGNSSHNSLGLTIPSTMQNGPRKSSIEIDINLYADTLSLLEAHDAGYRITRVNHLQRKFPDDTKVFVRSSEALSLAEELGYEAPVETFEKTRFLHLPVKLPRFNLPELADIAREQYHESIHGLAFYALNFSVAETAELSGVVFDPENVEKLTLADYQNPYALDYDYASGIVAELDAAKRRQAADKALDSEMVLEKIALATERRVAEAERMARVTDEVLHVITHADAFKALIAA